MNVHYFQVIEDHRAFNQDVSIETFFKKCSITLTITKDMDEIINEPYHYICRYRLLPMSRRKVQIEPVLEQERAAIALLSTPLKTTSKSTTPKTPSSLVKRMSRVSISEKNWSVTKNDGTKLLLKRAILADKNEKDPPIKATPKKVTETPKSFKKLSKNNLEDLLSMELKENSDDELPTLIIRHHITATPKRKQSISKITNEETPKKVLVFEDEKKNTPTPRRSRAKVAINYQEPEVSPMKRTPRKAVHKMSESDDEFRPTPRTPKTPKTPKTPRTRTPAPTPKHSVTKRILTSQLTPTLRNRAHSIDNIHGKTFKCLYCSLS